MRTEEENKRRDESMQRVPGQAMLAAKLYSVADDVLEQMSERSGICCLNVRADLRVLLDELLESLSDEYSVATFGGKTLPPKLTVVKPPH